MCRENDALELSVAMLEFHGLLKSLTVYSKEGIRKIQIYFWRLQHGTSRKFHLYLDEAVLVCDVISIALDAALPKAKVNVHGDRRSHRFVRDVEGTNDGSQRLWRSTNCREFKLAMNVAHCCTLGEKRIN